MKEKAQIFVKKAGKHIVFHPVPYFFGLIGILLVLIIVGNMIRTPRKLMVQKKTEPKKVEVYSIGSAPRIIFPAKIEKSGVIKIIAQTSGIVQKVYKSEGSGVQRGQWLVALSTTYQGANAPATTRQIAEKNYTFISDTYNSQKDIIGKNREMAEKSETLASELRDITAKSVDDTKALISLNENVVSMLDKQITYLESINVNGASDSALLQLKTGKASALAGLTQARASLRASEFQSGGDNTPADIARLQRDTAIKQLEVQEKALELNKEVALLNLRLAQIQESLMYPTSPFAGTVERMYVSEGQQVNPGTIIASINGTTHTLKVVVPLPSSIAQKVSLMEESVVMGGKVNVSVYPQYVSKEVGAGSLHVALFQIPVEYADSFMNEEQVSVEIPIGSAQTLASSPYIPIDVLYQTQSEAFVYIAEKENGLVVARSKKIKLGAAYGSSIQVEEGLAGGDMVIMDRSVSDGEEVVISSQ